MVDDILGTAVNDSICALSCCPLSQDRAHSAPLGLWQLEFRGNAESWKGESIHSPWIPAGCDARAGYPEISWHGRRMLLCTWRHQAWDGAPLNPTSLEQWERKGKDTKHHQQTEISSLQCLYKLQTALPCWASRTFQPPALEGLKYIRSANDQS